MIVVLSQKIDSESSYEDKLFNVYHYPARYRNQLHEGDIFVYYQGNRYERSQRYYFGTGRIGNIVQTDDDNFYAKLLDYQEFEKQVPIYLPDEGYIEQLGYNTIRTHITPPWQSSIRPLSQQAFDYILSNAGVLIPHVSSDDENILREDLKAAIRDFYVGKNDSAILQIKNIATTLAQSKGLLKKDSLSTPSHKPVPIKSYSLPVTSHSTPDIDKFIKYCELMKISYSYKPILILAWLQFGDNHGQVKITSTVKYFRKYYHHRKQQGLCIEKKPCIYLKDNITDDQILSNIIDNPVQALVKSGFFLYNKEKR